jgi:N-acetylglucosamine kinase-like BadF-type ATPase
MAPVFVKLAGEGNELCRNAVNNELKGIADLINILMSKNINNSRIDLAFTGGMIEAENYFSCSLFELLKNNFGSRINIITEFKNPLEGALKIAARRIAG